ncbi:MAG: hypothetical protein IJJ82_08560 [Clostridia bacterium]|nr:hypothetical protein [Clostridia bacterium]
MRYLICKNNVSNTEISARMKYIYDLFHIYTFKNSKNCSKNIIELNSIPTNQLDVIMIVGHDPVTNNYIINNIDDILENNIIVISCNTRKIRNLKDTKNKKIFLPKKTGKIEYYDGTEVGFEFDITDEENILFRNRKKEFYSMITSALERME